MAPTSDKSGVDQRLMPVFNSFRKYLYTGKVYNYNIVSDNTGSNNFVYYYFKDVAFDLSQAVFGKVTLTFSDDTTGVMPRARVEQLKDKDGNEVYPGGIWVFNGILPAINNFGQREGFRGTADLTFGTLPSGIS